MTPLLPSPLPLRVSHWLALDEPGSGSREEVFIDYAATWRGRDAVVRMAADRYTYADGRWSDWRIIASEAVAGTELYSYPRETLTDTARRRLGDTLRPTVAAWLDGDRYVESRRQAMGHMLYRRVRECQPYDGSIAAVHAAIEQHRGELPLDVHAHLAAALDAFDAYRSALDASLALIERTDSAEVAMS